jgi:branched-subunit amino acid ABC-type transport system permease component
MLAVMAIISGFGLGSMYGLLALGFSLAYTVSNIVNFARGSSMMLGAVLCYTFTVTAAGTPTQVRQNAAVRKAYLGDRTQTGLTRPAAARDRRDSALAVRHLSVGYGAAPVLDGVDLSVHAGKLVATLGGNGA